jgi:hypothetical protein
MRQIFKVFYLWLMPLIVLFIVFCSIFPEIAFPGMEPDVQALRIMSTLMSITYALVWFSVREALKLRNEPMSYDQWLLLTDDELVKYQYLYHNHEFPYHNKAELRREIYVRYISEFYNEIKKDEKASN